METLKILMLLPLRSTLLPHRSLGFVGGKKSLGIQMMRVVRVDQGEAAKALPEMG